MTSDHVNQDTQRTAVIQPPLTGGMTAISSPCLTVIGVVPLMSIYSKLWARMIESLIGSRSGNEERTNFNSCEPVVFRAPIVASVSSSVIASTPNNCVSTVSDRPVSSRALAKKSSWTFTDIAFPVCEIWLFD